MIRFLITGLFLLTTQLTFASQSCSKAQWDQAIALSGQVCKTRLGNSFASSHVTNCVAVGNGANFDVDCINKDGVITKISKAVMNEMAGKKVNVKAR
jgi:hypothetical protein